MNIIRYTINHINLDQARLLGPWVWLIGKDKEIIVVTKMGDLLLTDSSGMLYFLAVAEGSMEHISNYANDFFKNRLSAEQYYEIFQPNLIEDIEKDEMYLTEGQVYAYTKLPVKGGKISVANIHCADIYEYLTLTGTIHKEIDGSFEGK